MLGHAHCACDLDDIPARQEQARADAGAPSAASESRLNMWCLMFDDGASLPSATALQPSSEGSASRNSPPLSSAGGRVGGAAAAR
jgi:hypothetical protein